MFSLSVYNTSTFSKYPHVWIRQMILFTHLDIFKKKGRSFPKRALFIGYVYTIHRQDILPKTIFFEHAWKLVFGNLFDNYFLLKNLESLCKICTGLKVVIVYRVIHKSRPLPPCQIIITNHNCTKFRKHPISSVI